ncbi:hypothetical protein PsorP6_015457 [Peronosclerospora sorghi]|uniref:Uncharacterized protein n=1 Tax=Peronosclerospora sorghi TaxID=230839 RepID=A0ACC0WPV7_9STRA|nr:hypothetical protein PsorP6_015457 [Peronosclerospora sorghi]
MDVDEAKQKLLLEPLEQTKFTILETSKRWEESPLGCKDLRHKIYFTDVLTFEYLSEAQLLDVLTHLERYSGILVTSQRSAIAVSNAVNKLELELKQQVFKKLQSMPVFSVGAATSRELLPLGVI